MFAAFTVAVPVAVFLVVLVLLNARMSANQPVATRPVMVAALLVLLSALATRLVALPLTIMIIALLVVVLLVYHMADMHKMIRRRTST
jgi:hypothetical protein